MFTSYYKLQAHPFEREADPRFFFDAQQHRSALAALEKGLLAGGGFTVLTGGEDTGKTAVLDFAMSRLDPSQFTTARITAPPLGPDEILRETASVFGLDCQELSGAETRQRLGDFFIDCLRARKRPVLFVDQCERLPSVSLRALTSLADIRADDGPVPHIVLLGRSQLRQTLAGDDFAVHTRDRISGYHLQPLENDDTRRLIEYRLKLAGWQGDPKISSGAFEMIFLKTGGVPGKVTSLCAELLRFAASKKRHSIGNSLVRKVAAELQKQRRTGERDGPAVMGGGESVWLGTPENAPEAAPAGIVATSHGAAPSRWRRAIIYGEYVAGIVITVLIVWQVGTGFFGQEVPATAPVGIVTVPLPSDPDSKTESGDDTLAAMPKAEPADPPTAPAVAAPADMAAPVKQPAAEPGSPALDADSPSSHASISAPDAVLPATTGGQPPSDGVTGEDADPYADLTAQLAVTALEQLSQTEPDTQVKADIGSGDQHLPLVEAPEPTVIPEADSVTVATSRSSPSPSASAAPGDQAQSLAPTPLYKPDSLRLAEPPVPPRVTAADSSFAATNETAPSPLAGNKVQDFGPTLLYKPRYTRQPEPLQVKKPAAQKSLQAVMDQAGFGGKVPAPEAASVLPMDPLPKEFPEPAAEPEARPAALDQPAAAPDPKPRAASLEAAPAAAPKASLQVAAAGDTPAHPDLAVITLTLTRGIENKEPIDATDWFSASDGEVHAFARIKNPGGPTQVTFSWYHGDRLQASVALNVGQSLSWRTWSKSRIRPGNWRVEVADDSGRILAESSFTVE